RRAAASGPRRGALACSNLAHGFAACPTDDKHALQSTERPNLAIVSAYNDMLSAHQPLAEYPPWIVEAAREVGAVAQFAGGVPAMCDGVTQGEAGMELSLFSRDLIAQSTAIALSHEMFDAAICLGVCDKIIPGLLIGALSFGHLPVAFLPAGPMPSGLSNREKAAIRQRYAAGEITKAELLDAEARAYHSPGTCTFYGTANSNQMFMEVMGLHLPGASFVPPSTALREEVVRETARRVIGFSALGGDFRPIGEMVDERTIVNSIVGLHATGGSTNHTLHLVAVARAAGIVIDWRDMDELSAVVPLLTRVYPNGVADVNHFHQAGGLAYLIGQLLDAGLLHPDVGSLAERGGLHAYRDELSLTDDGRLAYTPIDASRDEDIVRPADRPFQPTGGLRLLDGNLGRAVIKSSAVKEQHRRIEAPAVVFDDQQQLAERFRAGELDRDFVAVVRFQGPRANGMPELHKLMPPLGVLQDRGFSVALVTDGRLSGASGKVPSAIHVTPEAHGDHREPAGPLAKVRDGDLILVDAEAGVLEARVDAAEWHAREPATIDLTASYVGTGRELFGTFRHSASGAEEGATTFGWPAAPAHPEETPAADEPPIVAAFADA
ncbi:MAG: phosphogluconate dehydratase, partial [Acidobacteriota bacterium]